MVNLLFEKQKKTLQKRTLNPSDVFFCFFVFYLFYWLQERFCLKTALKSFCKKNVVKPHTHHFDRPLGEEAVIPACRTVKAM